MISFLVNVDLTTAKELLVLASSPEEQKEWVSGLSSKIVRKTPQQKKSSPKYAQFHCISFSAKSFGLRPGMYDLLMVVE